MILHWIYISYDGLNDYKGNADIAIILGNPVHPDGTLSPWLEGRVEAAMQLYKEGRVKKIFASGGDGHDHGAPEGDAMKKYLVEHGVPATDIFADNQGNNTYLTALDFMKLNDSLHFSSAIAVSGFYHISRCKYIIQKVGFKNIYGFASKRHFWGDDTHGLFREFFAFYKYLIVY
jgi:vancomycin permeability regulator SanA